MPKRARRDPGRCAVCDGPKHQARLPHCRSCVRLLKYLLDLHRPDDVPRRVGAFRWCGRLPLEGRG